MYAPFTLVPVNSTFKPQIAPASIKALANWLLFVVSIETKVSFIPFE